MRVETIMDNNKKLIRKHNGLKTEKDVSLAILDVLTDISETLSAGLDFLSFIYGKNIVFPGDNPQMQNGGKGNG